jgi:hypothetical protein
VKKVLIVGAVLGVSALAVGAGATLGVVLGTRAIVVSAAAVKPAATLTPLGYAGVPPVVAMDEMAAAR